INFFFSSRRRHTRFSRDWSSDVCSSDLSNHVRYLSKWAKDGGEAHILFVVQRSDASRFRPNETTDPEFAAALAEAKESGVGIVRSEERRVGKRVDHGGRGGTQQYARAIC